MILREITSKITKDLFNGKVIILAGARQVGKTTLISFIIDQHLSLSIINGDDPIDRQKLENKSFHELDQIFRDSRIIYIDEAQKITNIGNILKLLVDNYHSDKQIIATGSSSLNLLSNTQEALTGRKYVHFLFGLSVREISPNSNPLELDKELSNLLIYGSYPEIYLSPVDEKQRILSELTSSYLYQDVLELENIRNSAAINKLLRALALQLGSEVSINELSNLVGIDAKTVDRYIDLLEKNFVIFRLPPYASNQRKTLSKMNKVYFYDLGIRNMLINNLNPLELRKDVGALWENFIILERMKQRSYYDIAASQFFWRTYDGAEVDLVESREGKLFGYEIKYVSSKSSPPATWLENPGASHTLINRENYFEWLKQ